MKTEDAFVKEFMRHRSALLGYILGVTGDFHLAEDIFQEVSVIAFRKKDSYTPGTSMGAWVREIARRKLLEEQRRVRRAGLVLGEDTLRDLENVIEGTEERWEREKEALQSCIRKLPARLQKLVRLRYSGAQALEQVAFIVRTPGR